MRCQDLVQHTSWSKLSALTPLAPIIESVSGDAKILASLADGRIVAAQQGHLLATSFHPELTNDTRFHKYFLTLVD